eukprot:Platyproteum_vivax@DN4471_c0_g1_i2.p1
MKGFRLAYWKYCWNQMVSYRLKELGTETGVVGDMVVQEGSTQVEEARYECPITEVMMPILAGKVDQPTNKTALFLKQMLLKDLISTSELSPNDKGDYRPVVATPAEVEMEQLVMLSEDSFKFFPIETVMERNLDFVNIDAGAQEGKAQDDSIKESQFATLLQNPDDDGEEEGLDSFQNAKGYERWLDPKGNLANITRAQGCTNIYRVHARLPYNCHMPMLMREIVEAHKRHEMRMVELKD